MSDGACEIKGWTIYAHPLFLDQLEAMIEAVEKARKKDPKGYKKSRAAKLLAAVLKVAFEDIPSDPTRDIYRQSRTLGDEYKHWFRAKFLQQFRLFFRYQQSAAAKIIVFAWVNDESSLRAYGSATDAYAVFRKMLNRGNPPDDWPALVDAARTAETKRRLRRTARLQGK
ncbi:MAG: type II toxin-antitoxin system YhaV family toxin [Hyphomicrobiales bacterium]|nr:type II toxin-antitoxin system YhaV family toxin [Hyphomicrobiales bacterium]MBV9754408.1 type II toxin-antitoxin system YhaV family toxin [Hyphomicrobiales bacterium]